MDKHAFPILEALYNRLRLAFESPQDKSHLRTEFFSLLQRNMLMRAYVQINHHLDLCIVSNPIDTPIQVHSFVSSNRERMTRCCLTLVEASFVKEAFALALRKDNVVASSYATTYMTTASASTPVPTKINAIATSKGRHQKSACSSN